MKTIRSVMTSLTATLLVASAPGLAHAFNAADFDRNLGLAMQAGGSAGMLGVMVAAGVNEKPYLEKINALTEELRKIPQTQRFIHLSEDVAAMEARQKSLFAIPDLSREDLARAYHLFEVEISATKATINKLVPDLLRNSQTSALLTFKEMAALEKAGAIKLKNYKTLLNRTTTKTVIIGGGIVLGGIVFGSLVEDGQIPVGETLDGLFSSMSANDQALFSKKLYEQLTAE